MAEAGVNLRETDAALRQAFREYENGVAFDNARRASRASRRFSCSSAASLDWVILPDRAADFLLIRAICAILLGMIFWYLGKARHSSAARTSMAQGIALLPLISICIMIAVTDGGNSVYYAGLNLVLVGLSLLLRWTFWNSLVMIADAFVCYIASVLILPGGARFRTIFGRTIAISSSSPPSSWWRAVISTKNSVSASSACARRSRRSRELLESQNRQLSELDEAKTRFFANISHELRTPLTIMLGITERLRTVLGRQSSRSRRSRK